MKLNFAKCQTFIAKACRPLSAAFNAISVYDTPGTFLNLSAISRATLSLSKCGWVT